jgi:copper chaperone
MNYLLNVQGMTCGHCEKAVTHAIAAVDPTAVVVIDRNLGSVEITSAQPKDILARAIEEEGYAVTA